ncbi:MAG: hypothetical protein HY748_07155 [Elusimicrobia bacterium]|nr:hypothetical protein [Elusimicrobiota bacterium]
MFASFRGAAKCAFLSALFLSVLAGVGSETLWRRPDRPTPFLMAAGTLGLRPRPRPGRGKSFLPVLAMLAASAAGGAGLWLLAHGNAAQDAWASLLGRLASTGVADVAAGTLRDPGFLEASARFAAVSLLAAAAKLALFGGLLSPAARACAGTGAGWAFIVLAVGEMLVFAAGSRASMSSRLDRPPAWKPSLLDRAGDARVLHEGPLHANSGMVWGSSNLWGHDPLLRKRYAEFMAVSQGLQPDQGGQYLRFTRTSPVLAILRLKRVLQEDPGRPVVTVPGAFPRVMLVRDWAVVNGRDAVLRALFLPGVDLAKLVILETPPFPGAGVQRPSQGPPAPGPPISWKTGGSARVVAETTDELDIEAQTPDPALLLVTDAYAPGWRASPLEGSDQREYRVLPADHVLRAVPLSPGRHRLRLEYSPTSFRVGAIVSALALAGFLGWTARLLMRRTNKESSGSLSFPS